MQSHVTRALASGKEHSTTSLGAVSATDSARVREHTGLDIAGYVRVMQSSDIRHVIKSHGDQSRETARGQIAVRKVDFEGISVIVESAHVITVQGNRRSAKGLRISYLACIGEHEYHYTEMVQTNRIVALKSMRKR